VAKYGLAKKDVLCEQALDLFVNNYGSEAGNLALKTLCFGGLYIGAGACGCATRLLFVAWDGLTLELKVFCGRCWLFCCLCCIF
jgi:glucokinase